MDVAGIYEGIREGGCIAPEEYEKEKVGEYTLLCELGKGEKAVVYLAVDSHGREVAIKAFLTETALNFKEYSKYYFDEQGASKLAKREWELGKILKHSNIAEVYDYFTESKNGEIRSYIVMEYVEKLLENTLSESSAVQVAVGLVDALIFGFQKGLIHRDLFSENMIVNREGVLKLIDIDSFDYMNKDLYDPKAADSFGIPMDPLDGYLKVMGGGVSYLLAFVGVSRSLGRLIPSDCHRNIQERDLSIILGYLNAVKGVLDSAEG